MTVIKLSKNYFCQQTPKLTRFLGTLFNIIIRISTIIQRNVYLTIFVYRELSIIYFFRDFNKSSMYNHHSTEKELIYTRMRAYTVAKMSKGLPNDSLLSAS